MIKGLFFPPFLSFTHTIQSLAKAQLFIRLADWNHPQQNRRRERKQNRPNSRGIGPRPTNTHSHIPDKKDGRSWAERWLQPTRTGRDFLHPIFSWDGSSSSSRLAATRKTSESHRTDKEKPVDATKLMIERTTTDEGKSMYGKKGTFLALVMVVEVALIAMCATRRHGLQLLLPQFLLFVSFGWFQHREQTNCFYAWFTGRQLFIWEAQHSKDGQLRDQVVCVCASVCVCKNEW